MARERELTPTSIRHMPKIKKTRKAVRFGKGKRIADHSDVNKLTTAEMRRAAADFKKQGYSQYDIAKALGVSQPRISHMLAEFYEEISRYNNLVGTHLLTEELYRLDALILAWYRKGKKDPRAAEVLFKFIAQRQKISGLEISKTELSGRGGGPIRLTASSIDITKLNTQQLGWLDEIMRIAGNTPPVDMMDVPELEYLE